MPPVASLVAADLIRDARDEHPSFDNRRHPDRVLLRTLSRYQRRLASKIIRLNPSVLTQVQETALPLADFEAGIVLPDFKYPAGVEAETVPQESGLRVPKFQVELVAWQARFRFLLAAYIRDNVLYLTGSERDWVGFTKIRFYYMPEIDDLTALTGVGGTLVVPNAASDVLVARLAAFMAQRGVTDKSLEKPEAREFRASWREAEDEFLDEMSGHTQAQTAVIREVF